MDLLVYGVGVTNPPTTLVSIQQGTLNLGTGVSAPSSLLQVAGDGSTGSWRTNSNYLPQARRNLSANVANGYVYVIGGDNSTDTTLVRSSIYYARINADGSTATWTTNDNSLSGARGWHSSIIANGYLYVIGGSNDGGTTIHSTVFYAKINSDGSTGSWTTNTNYLPAGRFGPSSVTANGYVYVIGGFTGGNQSTVFYAKLNADGSTGTWTTNSNYLSQALRFTSATTANGYVYVIGGLSGATQSTVYYAKLNSDGSIGTWNTNSNYLPGARREHGSIVANGYLYVAGGTNGSATQSTVYYAKLNSDGSIGSWTTNTNYLPGAREGTSSIIANGYVYVVAGLAGSALQSTIYYAPLATVSISANLNLLGLAGGSVGDSTGDSSFGSVGGSIYAGNIFSAGALEVSGNSQFWSGAGFFGPVSIGIGATSPSDPFSIRGTGNLFNITSAGNVGIGPSAPDYRLRVEGTGYFSSFVGIGSSLNVSGNVGIGTSLSVTSASALTTLNVTGISNLVGNVGIGTSLTVSGTNGLTYTRNLTVPGTADITTLYVGSCTGCISDPLRLADGTATAPTYSFSADTNTGLYRVGTDALALITGGPTGANLLSLNTTGVGIGTTSPTQKLQINGNDSSTFVVTSGGNVGIGFTTPTSLLHVEGDGSTGTWRTNSNYLPGVRDLPSYASANGYIYVIGGGTGVQATAQSTVYYARLNTDGSTGTWNTNINSLPAVRQWHTSVVANGYVYAIGGNPGPVSTVYYAKINADGSTGTWSTNTNYLPEIRARHSSVLANGYLYVIGGLGGSGSTVYYAKLNSDGSTGSWTTNSNYLPQNIRDHTSVTANGYVYVMGGVDTFNLSTVYYAKLNADGTIGTWSTNSNNIPVNTRMASSAISNGYIYVIGGGDNGLATVYYARLNADGSLGTFSTNSNSLPEARGDLGSNAVVANGYIYIMGGFNGSVAQSTVYYAPLQRVSIQGDLDLLGLAGANVGDSTGDSSFGSVGGSIYAGNIFSAGALEVSGNTQLWSGLGVNGPVNIGVGATNPPLVLVNISQGNTSLGTGYSAPDSLLQVWGDGSTGTWRTNANALPANRFQLPESSVVANGYVYVVGGRDSAGGFHSTVLYARINSDGGTGTWSTNTNYLTVAKVLHTTVGANGYIYAIGGCGDPCTIQSTIFYAKLNSDGSVGTFTGNVNSLPGQRYLHTSIVANGYVYVMGGHNGTDPQSTVLYAKLNADGSTGTWQTNSNYLPDVRRDSSSLVANGYVYIIGGCSAPCTVQSTVYYAKLNSDGSTGTWRTNANYLPTAQSDHSSVIANGYVYVMGGSSSTVYYAKLNSDGSLGSWSTNSNSLPASRSTHSSVIANGYVYVIGGGSGTTTIYYAPLATVSISANLNLLGLAGGSVGDSTGDSSFGSVGGSIYAGNIFSAGALEVSGNSQFWSGASFMGPVNIGVGASTPATGAAFSITGNTSLTGPSLPFFNVLNNGNVGIGVSVPTATLQIASNATCLDGTNASTACSINDYAELYPSLVPTEKGQVLVIDTSKVGSDSFEVNKPYVRPSNQPYQGTIIGIVTSDPAIVIEGGRISFMGGPTYEHNPYKPGVALAGRVPVKVSLENGPIEVGDFLTSSSTPGVAMKAIRPGQVVGKALESFGNDQIENGRILVFVNVTNVDPNNFLASLIFDNQGNLVMPEITAGSIILDPSLARLAPRAEQATASSSLISTNQDSIAQTTSSLQNDIVGNIYYDLTGKIASLEDRINNLESATPSATLADTLDITPPDLLLATPSATLANPATPGVGFDSPGVFFSEATVSGMLIAYQAQIQDHFKVFGETTIGNTIVAGDLTIDGSTSLTTGGTLTISQNSINAISTLYLQSSTLAEGLDIFNGEVVIDKEGNILATSVLADQYKINEGKSAGTAKIPAGQLDLVVENPYVEDSSFILLTPNFPIIQSVEVIPKEGSFTIRLSHPHPQDISFDYLIIGVDNYSPPEATPSAQIAEPNTLL